MREKAEIGIFGGSGFYSFLENAKSIKVETPYGPPSDLVSLGTIAGRKIAFIPRHGRLHQFPPHKVPYKANLWAMKSLGIKRIISPTAVGSLQPYIRVGDFVLADQFVDMTKGRESTFYNGPITTHISMAEPYCPEMREITSKVLKELMIPYRMKGSVVVIQGPRFSTKAESEWFTKNEWDIINMTQFPEVALARELEICYLNISVVTDYDVGIVAGGHVEPVTQKIVFEKFAENIDKLKNVIKLIIERLPKERHCSCGQALKGTRLGE